MQKNMRNPSHVIISFGNVDTKATSDSTLTLGTAAGLSSADSMTYAYEYSTDYATLELNRWVLDGKKTIAPSSGQAKQGYVSGKIAKAARRAPNKYFEMSSGTTSNIIGIVVTFGKEHDLPGLSITFDTRNGWTATHFAISAVDGSGTSVLSETVTDNRESSYVYDGTIEGVKELTLKVTGSNTPGWAARIENITFGVGRTFDDTVIISTKQSHDVDPLSRWLPKESMKFSVWDLEGRYDPDNPEGIYETIDVASPVEIQFGYELEDGSTEWLKSDKYVLNAKPTASKHTASFTGVGLLGSMSDTYYKGAFPTGTATLYDLAESVLGDAGLTPTASGGNPWVLDTDLKAMTTKAPLPVDTHANLLQMIAHAGRCKLYTDDDNIIHIERFELDLNADLGMDSGGLFAYAGNNLWPVVKWRMQNQDLTINFDSITQNTQSVTKLPELKNVDCHIYSYTTDESTSSLYEGEMLVDGQQSAWITLSSMAKDIAVTVTGATLVSCAAYAQAVYVTLGGTGMAQIAITGKPVTKSSRIYTLTVGSSGETDTEQNGLITDETAAKELAKHIAQYLSYRKTYTCQYRGNPELEVGDLIKYQTAYTNEFKALVLTDEITYNGSLSGALTVKGGIA